MPLTVSEAAMQIPFLVQDILVMSALLECRNPRPDEHFYRVAFNAWRGAPRSVAKKQRKRLLREFLRDAKRDLGRAR